MIQWFKSLHLFSVFLFITACSDNQVQTALSTKQQHYSEQTIKAADISKDGQYTLLSDNKTVCLWDNLLNKKVYSCLNGLEAQLIELLGISNNKRYFYTSNRINIHLYDLATGRLVTVWTAGDNIINDIAMSENEEKLVFGFRSGQASIVSVISNLVTTFKPHRLDINSVSISADGSRAFTGSSDKTAVLWDTKTGKALTTFSHLTRVNHVNISNDTKIAFTLDAIKDRNFWLTTVKKSLSELDEPVKFLEFNHSEFANKNHWLLSASPNQKLQLWQVKTGKLLAQWQAYKSPSNLRASVLNIRLINPNTIASVTSEGVFETWPLQPIYTNETN